MFCINASLIILKNNEIFFNRVDSVRSLFPINDYKTQSNLFLLITKLRKSYSANINNCRFFLTNSKPSIPSSLELNKTFKFNLVKQKRINVICFNNHFESTVFDKMFEKFYLGYLKANKGKNLTYFTQNSDKKKIISIHYKLDSTGNENKSFDSKDFNKGYLFFDSKYILISNDKVR